MATTETISVSARITDMRRNNVIPLRTNLILTHMQHASDRRFTVREKRDRWTVTVLLCVSAALWALIIVPFAL